VQALRFALALALVGCVQFDRPPERPPDAAPRTDANSTIDANDETLSEAADRVIGSWQTCMTVDDVVQSGLAAKWAVMLTEMGETCDSCHSAGGNGFMTSLDPTLLVTTLKSNRNFLLSYFTVDLTKGAGEAAMIVNAAIQEAVSQAQPPYATHPRYDPSEGLSASENLRAIVQDRLDRGQCN
jgi:hypothetical protein